MEKKVEKKYTAPDIKVVELAVEDILQTSGDYVVTSMPKTMNGAVAMEEQEIDIFN